MAPTAIKFAVHRGRRRLYIEELFAIAAEARASDLHLIVGRLPMLRIDGELATIANGETLTRETMESLLLSILNGGQKERFLQQRELDMSYEIPGVSRFRVNLH